MRALAESIDYFGIPLEESEKNDFLPEHLVMLDLEMSGVVPERDDILQIAMLKLERKGNQYEAVGEPLEIFMHSDKKPSNEFHEKFLKEIFAQSNASSIDAKQAKVMINEWLGDLLGKVTPCGDAVHCDMAFLYEKGCIDRGDIKDEKPVPGTFHYEIFDLNSVKMIARQKAGKKEELKLEAGIHNALVDCRNQTVELNYFLEILL